MDQKDRRLLDLIQEIVDSGTQRWTCADAGYQVGHDGRHARCSERIHCPSILHLAKTGVVLEVMNTAPVGVIEIGNIVGCGQDELREVGVVLDSP